MAKAKEITGLDCDADALVWAAETLRVRFAEVLELRDAALQSKDIEGVHSMRVATRRLRSALRDFAPLMRKKPLKKIKKNLKHIADTLGTARDEDVAIVALEKLLAKNQNAKIKEGISKLIEERRTARQSAQTDLTQTLDVPRIENLQMRFDRAISEATQRKQSARVVSFNQVGRNVVGSSLKEFCALGANIYEPLADEPLHELRIAAKRLRYAIELYTACWGERIAPFAAEVAEMQSLLGEIHDADVWLKSLGKRLQNSENDAAHSANAWLLSEFIEKRTKNYRSALRLWSDWKESDFIEKLQTTVLQAASES